MASTLNKLTGMGGDVRKIAALLQKKAPPGHKLAYINEEEAALLKSRGGSGKPHADTGIPSYQDETLSGYDAGGGGTSDEYGFVGTGGAIQTQTPEASQAFGRLYPFQDSRISPEIDTTTTFPAAGPIYAGAPVSSGAGGQDVALSSFPKTDVSPTPFAARDIAAGEAALTGQQPPAKEEGYADQLAKALGIKKDTLQNLGVAGITGLVGARTAGRAAQAGQAGKAEMQALAAPYQQQGQALQAQAQRGELTPQAQQSLQAVQAQAAQQAERRGGVGQAQMQAQVEAFRQQLLSQQYDYGLKLSGIGDNIALGAIRTGLQADQYVQQLTSNYFNNMARAVYGTAPQAPGVQYATQQAVT
jgi:hypothetical protein